jgi:hypothetical protein
MKKQMGNCNVGILSPDTPKGTVITTEVSVDETGKLAGYRTVGKVTGFSWIAAMAPLKSCHFAPYVVNGKATYYKGDVELTTR